MIAPAVLARLQRGVSASISISGGCDGAAATVEKSRTLTNNWDNENHPDLPRIEYAFALDAVAVAQGHRPPILSAMAADLGHVCIRLPKVVVGEDELAAALIDASAEFGDISTEIREATKDRKVCERDQARITLQIDEALASLGRLRAVVNACGKDA